MAGNNLFMPVWVDAYHADTRHLSTVQHGAYLLIMMSMWRSGGKLPNDEKLLARISGLTLDKWRRYGQQVMNLLVVDGDFVTQKRLLQELEKSRSKIDKKRAAGKAGGTANSLKNKGSRAADAIAKTVAETEQEGQQNPTLYSLLSTSYSSKTDSVEGVGLGGEAEIPDFLDEFRQARDQIEASEAEARSKAEARPKADSDAFVFSRGVIQLTEAQHAELKAAFPHIKFDRELGGTASFVERKFNENKRAGKPEAWWDILWAALAKKDREAEDRGQILKAKAEAEAKAAVVAGQAPKKVRLY
ncbi:DUF1376 domain-containing protein [Methylobacterium sp. WL120]|uniref:DUF1376 domain-containing protein n=1 Tax=Methylobacterium sp. WL120 TaxID=2603887 RepID=UPI00164F7F69|nr:DUF1376 domain-containing protein [Methylobacterium sp. WL120]